MAIRPPGSSGPGPIDEGGLSRPRKDVSGAPGLEPTLTSNPSFAQGCLPEEIQIVGDSLTREEYSFLVTCESEEGARRHSGKVFDERHPMEETLSNDNRVDPKASRASARRDFVEACLAEWARSALPLGGG